MFTLLLTFALICAPIWPQTLARHHLEVPSIAAIPQQVANAAPEFGHSEDTSNLQQQFHVRARRHFNDRTWTSQQIVEAIFCVFLPPLGVLMHGGQNVILHVLINVVLWVCGWVPGTIHAFWYCFFND